MARASQRYAFFALLSALTLPALAQTAAGRLTGALKDSSGGVLEGGRVEIRGVASGLVKTAVTGRLGTFEIDGVPAGAYRVSASYPGFATSVRDQVAVVAGRETTADFSLNIRQTRTVVEVTAPVVVAASIAAERPRTSDTAAMLCDTPGVSLYSSGGVSSLPVIHGMADDRVSVLVNGMSLQSACGNHMNPPLSYLDPSAVGAIRIMAGITPVSAGGDSIGGTIEVQSSPLEFALPGQRLATHGGVSAYHRTNGVVNGGSAWLTAATGNFAFGYTASYVNANDYKDGAGMMVKSTFYESENHALQLAARRGNHLFTAALGYQYIPQQGFVNARMDMASNEAKFASLRYEGSFARFRIDARVNFENTRHLMNILRDKIPGMNMPMDTRGINLGYAVRAEVPLSGRDTLRVGNEYRRFALDDWWTPVTATVGGMGPDTLWNVRNGRRDRIGTYVEWEGRRGRGWTGLLGVRGDVVRMNTDNVTGYNMSTTTKNSAMYYPDATEFNARDHARLDLNFEMTALARYEPDSRTVFELGYARKTRSPNLYERYLWVKRSAMSAQMNGWFGDGNGYSGNLDLRPETAHTVSGSVGWHDAARKSWELKITPYYTRVQDYIDVDRCPVIADGSNGCTAARFAATSGFVNLVFANHAARLYGVDGSGRIPLGGGAGVGQFALAGILGYVNGRNLDTRDGLYQVMPVNARAAIEHTRGNWSSMLDFQAVNSKRDVQAVRNELRTPGYALMNLRTSYQWHLVERASLRLDAGVENLANRDYNLPLGGRYWVGDKTGLSQTPGMGRSVYSGLTFEF